MSIKRLFVSHAGADSGVALRLAAQLRNAGHESTIDIDELRIGDNFIDFMNRAIESADGVIVLFSRHTTSAKWQNAEIRGALWRQVEEGGAPVIVVKLDDSPLPPLLGPNLFGTIEEDNPESYRQLVEKLCKRLLPERTASAVVFDAIRANSSNPFRYLRAEYFEERPDLHALAFAEPDPLTHGLLHEMKPCFVEGSRGTGKSMLLLSLRARNVLQKRNSRRDSAVAVFGAYLKLTRGALCNAGALEGSYAEGAADARAWSDLLSEVASQELLLQIIESLISELRYCCANGLLHGTRDSETSFVRKVAELLFTERVEGVQTYDDLLDRLGASHAAVAEFIRRRVIYGEDTSKPDGRFDLEQLRRVVRLIRRFYSQLDTSMVVVLLDEYENLFEFQQRIVNGIVKLAAPDFSVKVAKKYGTSEVSGTSFGQELQETHDYSRLPVVYDVEDPRQRSQYTTFLKLFVQRICECEGMPGVDVLKMLPVAQEDEADYQEIEAELSKLSKLTVNEFRALPEDKRRERTTYYREAAIHRAIGKGKRRKEGRTYSGFDSLAFVSSGVIRYFQEFLGVAFHLHFHEGRVKASDLVIPPKVQSDAVYLVSQHNLTTVSRNIERHGEDLKYFLLDLGDCLRQKLLRHTSEPEAGRLTIRDPERLADQEMAPLWTLLRIGQREGIFQTAEGMPAFKPKHGSDPQPAEFSICRIFAPVLEISPRLRWRTTVDCHALLQLTKSDTRKRGKASLMKQVVRDVEIDEQPELGV